MNQSEQPKKYVEKIRGPLTDCSIITREKLSHAPMKAMQQWARLRGFTWPIE